MIEILDFKREHMFLLLDEPNNAKIKPLFANTNYDMLEKNYSHTIVDSKTKKVLCCAGVMPYWANRGEGWIIFADKLPHMLFVAVQKAVVKFLDNAPFKRVEASIDLKEKRAHRWIRSLGFIIEAPIMQNYWPDGSDYSLYARIK